MIFQRCAFGEIAKKINKDHSTISREIRRHSVIEKSGYSGFGFNTCVHKETCKMGMVCGDKCLASCVEPADIVMTTALNLRGRFALLESSSRKGALCDEAEKQD